MQKNQNIFLIGRSGEIAIVAVYLFLSISGCRPPEASPAANFAHPTVASLSPAASDLIIGIGAANHLVAISDPDPDRPEIAGLPRVGDFDHVDWEKLAVAHPDILVTQFGNRMPSGLLDRCKGLGIQVIDVQLSVMPDTYREADVLGKALGVESQEQVAVESMQNRLNAIASRVAGQPKVRAVIAMCDGGNVGLIGPPSYHDDLLAVAGGINVADKKPYSMIDREHLADLAPEVIFDLEPVPPTTPQEIEQADRYWESLPNVPAVKNGRVYRITDPYCGQPGWHAADLADTFARDLHGQ